MTKTIRLLPALLAGLLSLPAFAVSPVENDQYDAQGNLTQRTDGAGHATTFGYDPLGRLLQLTRPDGGVVALHYDGQDDVTQATDPVGQTTQYTRNAWGDVVQTVSPDTGTTTRTYDAAGNVLTVTDALGQVTTYTYDALNRPLSKHSSVSGTPAFGFGYDTCPGGVGRLCQVLDGSNGPVIDQFAYDDQGRLARRDSTIQNQTLTTAYRYQPGGALASVTYPDGRVVSYQYDAQGRVSEVDAQASEGGMLTVLANQFSYAPFGEATAYTFGNGLAYRRALDTDGRPTAQQSGPWGTSASYDAAGNVAALQDSSGTQQSFGYDPVDRLTQATDPSHYGSLSYTYDLNGNRTQAIQNAVTTPYTYSPANWLAQVGSDYRGRDAAGNPLFMSGMKLASNGYQQLVTVYGTPAGTVANGYDAFGARTTKTVNGQTTRFVYGPNRELLAEQANDGSLKDYVWLDGKLLARLDSVAGANTPTVTYYHTDALGTPQAMTNAAGQTVWQARYTPFGQATVTVTTVQNNIRFPGQYYDQETGLNYNYFRMYEPKTGRYVQADPLGLAAGMNVYAYVGGNPLDFIDPTGLTQADIDNAVRTMQAMTPNWRHPSSVKTWSQDGKGGKHSFWDKYIYIDSKYLGCLDDGEAGGLLLTILHETAHLNQTWYQFGIDNLRERVTGGDSSNAQDTAESILWNHDPLFMWYMKNRNVGQITCQCRK